MFGNKRYVLAWIIAPLLLLGLILTSVATGSVPLSFTDVLTALGLAHGDINEMTKSIVLELRLPRTLLGIIAGAGLALVGALLQTTTRNDLADPFLFGLSSGASAGVVLVITRLGDSLGAWTLPVAAFVGGMLSAAAVIIIFMSQSHKGTEKLIICGLAVSFLFGALTNFLIFSGDQRAASNALFWALGGLGLARWENLGFAAAALVILIVLIFRRGRALDALLAGEQTAWSLGINVSRLRTEVFICCSMATAILVSLTGVIGFVGLMVPHLARPFTGVRHRRLLPLVGVLGAVLLSAGDILSRTLTAPQELPIGIITAGVGGVFVLVILLRRTG
ncbi:FecCD family ABC transporter permease [Buttiauxella agrestis]|uniref:Permease component of an ABC superfamily iron siderophore transporter n=1 Tax=Buttiauxella agrestis ATCC 33320 TaxID=1006004 RepID=A0A085GE06_9ENTR|nr:iron ABC transporter permease [Buttiauxella agrestis]KFC81951.1 permease component of an ABC superfamily iron siderophore transporter [Buttiauxella agrestis ATCC 33320]